MFTLLFPFLLLCQIVCVGVCIQNRNNRFCLIFINKLNYCVGGKFIYYKKKGKFIETSEIYIHIIIFFC